MKTDIKFLTYDSTSDSKWAHYKWDISINGVHFAYRVGTGHASKQKPEVPAIKCPTTHLWVSTPLIDEVLECLFSDADAGSESFDDFCSNFGYSNDSIDAFTIYRSCMDNAAKLKKALGAEYTSERERIESNQ